MRDAGEAGAARRWFLASWALLGAAKLALAWRLPLFVDEAFYWQEGRHPAWAYSDLPGLTAWLARLGDMLAPAQAIGLRLPFLAIGALVPWIVVVMARREFGERVGWQAGLLALLLPLAGTMGLLALPDVPLLLASALCLDAGLRLLRHVDRCAAMELALGLVIGGLTHYRFAAVIAVGFVALLALREGRLALRDGRLWLAVLAGALAWLPLLAWNLQHADAGVRFQLVERHPWSFSSEGLWLGVVQLLLVTPLLLVAMAVAVKRGLGHGSPAQRYLALSGVLIVAGFFVLGFFADRERVSFHWPLPGHLALLPLAPLVISGWPRGWRLATRALALLGLLGALAYYTLALLPAHTTGFLRSELRPPHFSGWDQLDAAVATRLAAMPPDTRLLAGNFKIGAQLGHARNTHDIPVLAHPLNEKHGRAAQLATWGLLHERFRADHPVLLIANTGDVAPKDLLAYYQALCRQVGALPSPQVLNIDHGRERFLLFAMTDARHGAACVTPALSYIDAPAPGAAVAATFDVAGWAFKDGVGLARVEVLLDGHVVAQARYGEADPGIAAFWKTSTDPNHPNVYFRARIDAARPGTRWLGLRLHGADGSVEDSAEQRIVVR